MTASKLKVGVVRGGTSSEYDVSLKTGATILKHLPSAKYQVHDILITKNGTWHFDGIEKKAEAILKHVDVIFNALHGEFGEDGKIQKFLDAHGVKYTGSGSLSSAIAMNKALTKKHALNTKIKTPVHLILRKGEPFKILEIFKTFPHPAVVKPATAGSSIGVSIVKTLAQLEAGIKEAFLHSDTVLLEECISGREATCGVIDGFRGEVYYTLPPVEIISPKDSDFFDFKAKYGGASQEICPGNFSPAERDEIQRLTKEIHHSLGLQHYSRSDFIVHPRRGIYFLEVNTLPGLTEQSLFPKSLEAVGASLGEFLDHVVSKVVGRGA